MHCVVCGTLFPKCGKFPCPCANYDPKYIRKQVQHLQKAIELKEKRK